MQRFPADVVLLQQLHQHPGATRGEPEQLHRHQVQRLAVLPHHAGNLQGALVLGAARRPVIARELQQPAVGESFVQLLAQVAGGHPHGASNRSQGHTLVGQTNGDIR